MIARTVLAVTLCSACAEQRLGAPRIDRVSPTELPLQVMSSLDLVGYFPGAVDADLDQDAGTLDLRYVGSLGPVSLVGVVRHDATTMSAEVPPIDLPGIYDLRITNARGKVAILRSAVRVGAADVGDGIASDGAMTDGGDPAVAGGDLTPACTVPCECAAPCTATCVAADCGLFCDAGCNVSCPSCTAECSGSSSCTFECVSDCSYRCTNGAPCEVTCGARCAIDRCNPGSACLLRCSDATDCRLDCTAGTVTDCGGGVWACRRPCP